MMFNFKKKSSEIKNIILGIVLKEVKGILMVFEPSHRELILKAKKEFIYSNAFENLVEDIDQQLVILEKEGYKDFSKTIYFLNEIFIDEKTKEIRKSFLPKFKEIEDKLDLKTLGYAEINEVIVNQIEKENNLPLSAIFLNIEKTYFQFILRKAGKNIFEKIISRSDNFLLDFYEGINSIKDHTPLPIRIIMFDDDSLEKEKNTLITHQFKDEYFIQAPKIEVISPKLIDRYLTDVIKEKLFSSKEYEIKESQKPELFGFVLGKDVKNSLQEKNLIELEKPEFTKKIVFPFWDQYKKFFLSSLSLIRIKINNINFVILGLILIIVAVFVNEYFFHRVKIIITTKKLSFKKNINLSEDELAMISKEFETEVNKTINTSAEKLVGEKAKGVVNLYNYSFNPLKLSPGTIIFFNDIKFAINEDVKIASASYIGNQLGNPLEPGKTEVTVTAVNIGENGNLPKGTLFQIEGISPNQAVGKNETAFTGGSQKKVKIFSTKDKEKLKNLAISDTKKNYPIPKNLLEKNLVLINDLTQVELIEENYSHRDGEETDKVNLKATLKTVYYFYNQEKLKEKILEKLKKDIPENYMLKSKNVNLTLKNISQKDNKKDFEFNTEGFYNKKVSLNNIKEKLTFLNKKSLSAVLESDDIEKYSLKEENKIPLFSGYLPFFIHNIQIIEN